jgi:signal transduction histidine kinase
MYSLLGVSGMGFAQAPSDFRVPLETILCTDELGRRPVRQPNHEAVASALVELAQTIANSPERVLQRLVETALELCQAHSSGISLLEEENGSRSFRWHGVAGVYAPHLWGTTPRDFSPCGTVLDTDKVQLMSHLDRHFEYFAKVKPHIAEALLVPFHVRGEAVGTIWVISHDETRKFDAEDARVLTKLGEFASASYQALSLGAALKSIVETIQEPLLVLDSALRIKTASRSFYETFQGTPDATIGCFLYQLGNGEWNIPTLRTRLEDILPMDSVLENFEIRLEFSNLGPRVMSLSARKLVREDNPTSLILLTIADITARKRVEDELLRSYEDSQRFAYVAAHDLRAPVRTCMTLLDVLENQAQERMNPEDSELLSMARSNLDRLQVLMSDILAYSQIGGAQATKLVPLRESLEMALTNLKSEIEETATVVDCGTLPIARADRALMTLVFQNLLNNAIKYRANLPPRIRVEGKRENGEWVLAIADNGQGFNPRYAEMIFLPFKRLHGPDMPGSGIGLATCKRVVERLGGRIWAQSAAGKGATFYFTLPER